MAEGEEEAVEAISAISWDAQLQSKKEKRTICKRTVPESESPGPAKGRMSGRAAASKLLRQIID